MKKPLRLQDNKGKQEARNQRFPRLFLTSCLPHSLFWALSTAAAPGVTEEPDPVALHDPLNCFLLVSPFSQQIRHALQIRDGIDVQRRLFAAEPAVQVG